MDLYEALKSGASEKELLESFNKDLNEAKEKITKEKEEKEKAKIAAEEAAKKEHIAEWREEVAYAFYNYFNVILDDDFISRNEIEEILKEFEKNLDNLSLLIKLFDKKTDKNKEFKIPFKSWKLWDDDAVIENFIKTL